MDCQAEALHIPTAEPTPESHTIYLPSSKRDKKGEQNSRHVCLSLIAFPLQTLGHFNILCHALNALIAEEPKG